MNKVILLLPFILFGCGNSQEFNREQCIVQIYFKIPMNSKKDMDRFVSIFMDDFIREYVSEFGDEQPPPSSANQGDNSELIYLQYANNCDNKISVTKQIVKNIYKFLPQSSPKAYVSNKSFKPAIDTIEVSGKYWKDKE